MCRNQTLFEFENAVHPVRSRPLKREEKPGSGIARVHPVPSLRLTPIDLRGIDPRSGIARRRAAPVSGRESDLGRRTVCGAALRGYRPGAGAPRATRSAGRDRPSVQTRRGDPWTPRPVRWLRLTRHGLAVGHVDRHLVPARAGRRSARAGVRWSEDTPDAVDPHDGVRRAFSRRSRDCGP